MLSDRVQTTGKLTGSPYSRGISVDIFLRCHLTKGFGTHSMTVIRAREKKLRLKAGTVYIPKVDEPSSSKYISDEIRRLCPNLISMLRGQVFFTHRVSVETKLSGSILSKTFNRVAAVMTKANTVSIDFSIPVVMNPPGGFDKNKLGPFWRTDRRRRGKRPIRLSLTFSLIPKTRWRNLKLVKLPLPWLSTA